eukprot:Hpha_TRINITY_DN4533_c0_g1::TRINITY_DN4533_c0_g1_i1::g.115542::m.115542
MAFDFRVQRFIAAAAADNAVGVSVHRKSATRRVPQSERVDSSDHLHRRPRRPQERCVSTGRDPPAGLPSPPQVVSPLSNPRASEFWSPPRKRHVDPRAAPPRRSAKRCIDHPCPSLAGPSLSPTTAPPVRRAKRAVPGGGEETGWARMICPRPLDARPTVGSTTALWWEGACEKVEVGQGTADTLVKDTLVVALRRDEGRKGKEASEEEEVLGGLDVCVAGVVGGVLCNLRLPLNRRPDTCEACAQVLRVFLLAEAMLLAKESRGANALYPLPSAGELAAELDLGEVFVHQDMGGWMKFQSAQQLKHGAQLYVVSSANSFPEAVSLPAPTHSKQLRSRRVRQQIYKRDRWRTGSELPPVPLELFAPLGVSPDEALELVAEPPVTSSSRGVVRREQRAFSPSPLLPVPFLPLSSPPYQSPPPEEEPPPPGSPSSTLPPRRAVLQEWEVLRKVPSGTPQRKGALDTLYDAFVQEEARIQRKVSRLTQRMTKGAREEDMQRMFSLHRYLAVLVDSRRELEDHRTSEGRR